MSLRLAISTFEHCGASDKRDHVYALLSLVKSRERVRIDYGISTDELWWHVLWQIVVSLWAPVPVIEGMLYSRTAETLGMRKETYREMIRSFIQDFVVARRSDHTLTIEEFEAGMPSPYKQWRAFRRSSNFASTALYLSMRQRLRRITQNAMTGHGPDVAESPPKSVEASALWA